MQATGVETAMVVGLVANLLAVLAIAWKMSRFMAQIEMKVDLMWIDFNNRNQLNRRRHDKYYKRAEDERDDEHER